MKTSEIIGALAKKLGHTPTEDELAKGLNGTGLILLKQSLAEQTKSPKKLEISEVPVPDINGEIRCRGCLSYDDWKYLSEGDEDGQKYFTYECQGRVNSSPNEWCDFKCETEITIFLDDENQPILPKVRK